MSDAERRAIFSKRLAKLRENDDGNTRAKLADLTGKSLQNVSHYFRGRTEPDFENLCRIANYFGTTTDYLLGLSNISAKREDTWGKDVVETIRMLINDDFYDIDTLVNLMNEVARAMERKARNDSD